MQNLFDYKAFAEIVRVKMAIRMTNTTSVAKELDIGRSTLQRIVTTRTMPNVEHYLRLVAWINKD